MSVETETRLDLTNPRTLVAAAVFIAMFALLSFSLVGWLNASSERRRLQERLDSVQTSLAQLQQVRETAPAELERQLEEVHQRLEELLRIFPSSEEVAAELLAYDTLAARYDATITRLESLSPEEVPAQEVVVREETYALEARGAPRNLLFLFKTITEAPFETFFFRDLTFGEDGPAWAAFRIKILFSDFDWETWRSQAATLAPGP